MGNWHISIRGIGSHHNKKNAADANRMAAKFVQELRDAGHLISDAAFTHGASDAIGDGAVYLSRRDDLESK